MMMLMKLTAAHISFICFINISIDQTGYKVTQSDYGCCETLHTHAPFVNLSMTATHGVTPEYSRCHWWLGIPHGRMSYGEEYRLERTQGWPNKVVVD
jgi:hypothetical protein